MKPKTPHDTHPGAAVPPTPRRGGREAPRELTSAFGRYVSAVQVSAFPAPADDFEAALTLAEEIMGHVRRADVDAALVQVYGPSMRALGTAVRRAGHGAAAHPALLARAIVMARTLERTAARPRREAVPTGS